MAERGEATAPFGTTRTERATMARGLAFLFFAGATLVAATLLLPDGGQTSVLGVFAPAVLAWLTAALLAWAAGRPTARQLSVVLAFGTGLITVCVVSGGESATAYPLMYVWVSMYAAYFFAWPEAMAHVALAGAAYAVGLGLVDDAPVPGVHWVMGMGTVAVGGVLLGRLTKAIRAQAHDLAVVAQMANGLSDVAEFAHETCAGLRASTGAACVVMLEPLEDGDGLRVTAMAGTREAGLAFSTDSARAAIARAYKESTTAFIQREDGSAVGRRLRGASTGLAQPILRDGKAAGVLALAWTSPRRAIGERAETAAMIFAAEASVALDRAERFSREKERRALEINDNIVQGLVLAKYAAQAGHVPEALRAIDETLERARRLITDALEDEVAPGDLVRGQAPSL